MQNSTRSSTKLAAALAIIAASATLLGGCASSSTKSMTVPKRSKEYFAESIFGVKASPRVSWLRKNLPRGGGRDQVGKPYMVRGKWYYPKEEKGYSKVGGASWYGDAFHGRLTANGEVYDMTHLTGAHPTMPLPSYARVTNLTNGSSVIIRVNDRGPYSDGRIIDLSRQAAEMLDYQHTGVTKVKVDYVGRAPLDGHDEQYLVASYRPGNGKPDPSVGLPTGVMIAMNGPTPLQVPRGAAPILKLPAPNAPAVATTAVATVALPAFGPIAPARPQVEPGQQVAFATMGYAAAAAPKGPASLAAFDAAGHSANAGYVAAGTFKDRAKAAALAERLQAFGDAAVRQEAVGAFSVILRPDGRMAGDALIEAAWANGAPDAIAVRE